MGQVDFVLLLFVYLQPPFLGFVLFNLTYTRLSSTALFEKWGGARRR